ncbi:MAG: class I SAM-dependent methyltransferase [Acidobacteriaceae bacterium]
MGQCRNCGSDATENLGFVGSISPFFLKRVLDLEMGVPPAVHPVKKLLRQIPFAAKAFRRIYGGAACTEMEICRSCTFVQTRIPFRDEAIAKLYADYRADSYNRERIHYEPSYAAIAQDVGGCRQEIEARTGGLTQWLASRITPEPGFSMLDFGGADGKFLPTLPGTKSVYEISNITPAPGITRIEKASDLGTYSYVQLAHVLEHVPNPLLLTKKAASLVKPGGYLYIEVPIEISDRDLDRLLAGDRTIPLPIHEHINRYSERSMTELLRSANLIAKAVETRPLDCGWIKTAVIRALAQPAA